MTTPGVGERVTVITPDSHYFLEEGVVIALREATQVYSIRVRLDRWGEHWFKDSELSTTTRAVLRERAKGSAA